MTGNGRLFGGVALLISALFLVVIILIGGALAYQFLKFRNAGLEGLQTAPQAVVAITSPLAFSQAPEGSPLQVDVSSSGYQPLASTELWVDGILMGVQAAPPSGPYNFDTTFLWSPGPAGAHTLVARTMDMNGEDVLSSPILVNIIPNVPPEGASVDAPFDAGPAGVLPASDVGGGGNLPPVNGPAPNESESPAQLGLPTVGDWVVDITNTAPPTPPGLTASTDACAITLHIHDLSENEEGFQVFRSSLAAPAWTNIATLSSQSATEWISYTDELGGPSQVSYYVAALNNVGQAKSQVVPVDLTGTGCTAPNGDQQIFVIEPVSFHIDAAIDQAYCYQSMGGVHWERWPSAGFFLPGADGFDIQPYPMTFALNGLDGDPLIEKLDLYVECWGWAGGELTYLGKVHFTSTDLFDLGEQEQEGGIFAMGFRFKLGKYDPYSKFLLPPPDSKELPYMYAELDYGSGGCKYHLPPEFQNVWGALLFCTPFPGYSSYAGMDNAQPYLLWELDDYCPHGADCQTMESLLALAEENGGSVFFSVYDQNDYIDHVTFIPAPFTSHVVTPLKCNGTRIYTVKLIYTDAANYVEGPESNQVSIPCPVIPPATQAELVVSFDTLTLSNVDDAEADPDQIEVYGLFLAGTIDGSGGGRTLAERDYVFANNCPGDIIQFGGGLHTSGLGNYACPGYYESGSYSLASLPLCNSDYTDHCFVEGESLQTEFVIPNNTIPLTVGDGQSILLQVMLIDWDDISGDDVVCFANIITSGNSLEVWASSTIPFVLSHGFNGHAGCKVQGTISPAP